MICVKTQAQQDAPIQDQVIFSFEVLFFYSLKFKKNQDFRTKEMP
jgi:hypothetical protein